MRRLQAYDWPGNVRELQNVIERALITQQPGRRLHFDLPGAGSLGQRRGRSNGPSADSGEDVIPEFEMRRRERENLLAALRQTNWRIYGPSGAADLLGVKPTTLSSRVKKMGLERPRP